MQQSDYYNALLDVVGKPMPVFFNREPLRFREWLSGDSPKQIEVAWNDMSSHSSMWWWRQYHSFTVSLPLWIALKTSYQLLWLIAPYVTKPYAIGFHELCNIAEVLLQQKGW